MDDHTFLSKTCPYSNFNEGRLHVYPGGTRQIAAYIAHYIVIGVNVYFMTLPWTKHVAAARVRVYG